MSIELITDGIIDLIKKNLIAETNVTSDVTTGDVIVSVENSRRFNDGEEVVLIDWGYNDPNSLHYHSFEYAKIKEVVDTRSIELQDAVQSDWLTSKNSYIQKTIGHSPLYSDNVLYGDREVIKLEDMTITVEPASLSNEWIYIQGGLSEDYKVRIVIYGKDIKFEEGRRILDRYSWAVYSLLNNNLHLDIDDKSAPLFADYDSGSNLVTIEDTPENTETFGDPDQFVDPILYYRMQDNLGSHCGWFRITDRSYGGGFLYLTISPSLSADFLLDEYASIIKKGEYIYDSRADNIEFGQVSKGSAFLRAAEISWFGKKVNRHIFPQIDGRVDDFKEIDNESSSSSSSIDGP